MLGHKKTVFIKIFFSILTFVILLIILNYFIVERSCVGMINIRQASDLFLANKTSNSDSVKNNYENFHRLTLGIRNRQTKNNYIIEQIIQSYSKSHFITLVSYADPNLKNKNPVTKLEKLENCFIEMLNDKGIYIYKQKYIHQYLAGKLSKSQLMEHLRLKIWHPSSKGIEPILLIKALERKSHTPLKNWAQLIHKTFKQTPHRIDKDFLKAKALLSRSGIPLRVIPKKEYQSLAQKGYPLAPFLLKLEKEKRINMLPNCAQGATQLIYGKARYTKVKELVRDRWKLFNKIKNVNALQIGDLVLNVWDSNADAQTNSGHVGVVVNLEYSSKGKLIDARLIEFFPANYSPVVVKMSKSYYNIPKGSTIQDIKLSKNRKTGVFLLRPKKNINLKSKENSLKMLFEDESMQSIILY